MKLFISKIRRFCPAALGNLISIICPSCCAGCGRSLPPGQVWCSDCWQSVSLAIGREHCPRCGIVLGPYHNLDYRGKCFECKELSVPVDGVCVMGSYEGLLAESVRNFKYNGNIHVGELLSDSLVLNLLDQDWVGDIDLLCEVPIHWTRRLSRGFNQSKIIAEILASSVDLPRISLLKRVRPTRQQVGLSATARKENIKGAFQVKRSWNVKGANICLVDDVMTTGSTLFEAARVLKKAGAKKVYAVVILKMDQW